MTLSPPPPIPTPPPPSIDDNKANDSSLRVDEKVPIPDVSDKPLLKLDPPFRCSSSPLTPLLEVAMEDVGPLKGNEGAAGFNAPGIDVVFPEEEIVIVLGIDREVSSPESVSSTIRDKIHEGSDPALRDAGELSLLSVDGSDAHVDDEKALEEDTDGLRS